MPTAAADPVAGGPGHLCWWNVLVSRMDKEELSDLLRELQCDEYEVAIRPKTVRAYLELQRALVGPPVAIETGEDVCHVVVDHEDVEVLLGYREALVKAPLVSRPVWLPFDPVGVERTVQNGVTSIEIYG